MRIREIFAIFTLTLTLLPSVACSKKNPKPFTARMGENLTVGSLVYNVIETEWKEQLGEGATGRLPANRFLLLRLTVTNSGGAETIIPAMTLFGPGGVEHREITDGTNVPNWLGMVRNIKPAQTEQGTVVFDVPVGSYSLQVSSESDDPERELLGRVDIPLKLESESPAPSADKAVPVN